jgi:hypothetical protein
VNLRSSPVLSAHARYSRSVNTHLVVTERSGIGTFRTRTAILLLLVVAIYFPTSVDGYISVPLFWVSNAVTFSFLGILFVRRNGILGALPLSLACCIPGILVLFTMLSPSREFSYGASAPFALISIVTCLNLRDVGFGNGRTITRIWLVLNVVNLSLIVFLLFKQGVVVDFFVTHFSGGYDGLVETMLAEGKPVLTFASHSTASFFYFTFFVLNLLTYTNRGKRVTLLFALLNLACTASLQSVSGYILTFVGVLILVVLVSSSSYRLWFIAAATILIAAIIYRFPPVTQFEGNQSIVEAFMRRESGFRARYTSGGVLWPTISYIVDHPFSPIGLGFSRELWLMDSGPVNLILRGSLPLLVTVYGALWSFLRRNLFSRKLAYGMFTMYLAFEIGMTHLYSFRAIAFLPFTVVYLNFLESNKKCPGQSQYSQKQSSAI